MQVSFIKKPVFRFAKSTLCAALAAGILATASGNALADEPLMLGLATAFGDPLPSYAAARSIGATSVRLDVPWAKVEIAPGKYQLPNGFDERLRAIAAANLEPLLILDYGNPRYAQGDKPRTPQDRQAFANYAAWVVSTLKGRVRYFELWNEWETKVGGTTPGTAEDYVELARVTVPRLRQANPAAIILSAGMSYPAITTDYFDHFLNAGGAELFDGLSFHPYAGALKKDWTPEHALTLLDGLQARVQKRLGGQSKDFYITEMGYSNFRSEFGYTPRVTAAFVRRFVLLADTRPFIRAIWWYQLRDQGHDPAQREQRFGIFDDQLNPKPAAQAFADIARSLKPQRGRAHKEGGAWVYESGDGRVLRWNEVNPATGQAWPRNGDDADRAVDAGAEPRAVMKAN